MNVLKNCLIVSKKEGEELKKKFIFTDAAGEMHFLFSNTASGYKFPYGAKDKVISFNEVLTYHKLNTKLNCNFVLRQDQKAVVDSVMKTPSGVIFSPPGSGKTVMGCYLINEFQLTTLILVPTLYLLNQWVERINKFLNYDPGVIGSGKCIIKDITVAIFNSASTNLDSIKSRFSFLIVDEAHRIAADTYKEVVGKIHAPYKLGMTGTLKRKDGKEFIVTAYLGYTIHENTFVATMTPAIIVVQTNIKIPKLDYVKSLNWLAENELFNNIIASNILKLYKSHLQLALMFRKAQLESLKALLPESTIIISGSSNDKEREDLSKNIEQSRIILSTTVLDEGADIQDLNVLHLCSPFNNIPKLEQRIHRVTRTKEFKRAPIIFDYWFSGGGKGWTPITQQRERLSYYKSKNYKVLTKI